LDPDPNPHEFALIWVGCIRIQVGKNDPQKVKKFIVLKGSLLRARGFSRIGIETYADPPRHNQGGQIRIPIGSGFNRVSASGFGIQIWIRIQEGKINPQQ
jgi:hypothetical protein